MDELETELAAYLRPLTPGAVETATWLDGRLHLRMTSYLTDHLPPVTYVNSVRAVVVRGDAVLVLRNLHGEHVLPGGRREPGEMFEATLRREVREETGWSLDAPTLLGISHFHVLPPLPPAWHDPRSGFINLVYLAAAATHAAADLRPDGYELAATFRSAAEVARLSLSAGERLFLDAALRRQGRR